MVPASTPTTLSSSHPLIAELTSLRQQLTAYQKAAHTAGIQLQGSRLECALAQEESSRLKDENDGLRKEVEILRNNPTPPSIPPKSTALTELSLAHRRLSTKLDLTESSLNATQLELQQTKYELERVIKDREGDRSIINELKRVEDDREEEIEWERGERKKIEEQKKLCDLALQEYSTLVHSLDPSAVPPPTPSKYTSALFHPSPSTTFKLSSPSDGGLTTPDLTEAITGTDASASSPGLLSPSESISNLLVGQRGVHQLFEDFASTLSAKERALHALEARVEELQHSLETVQEQLQSELVLRVQAQADRENGLRDDASAARVVERYMTFTQKTHATIHMHLDTLRRRSQATQATLRSEVAGLRKRLLVEKERGDKLRMALDEMSEGLNREAAGRRREVALRLKMIASDEKRGRKIEIWLDHVRRAREGADGAVLEADVLESLVDEGIEAVSDDMAREAVGKDKQRSWRGLLSRRKDKERSAGENSEKTRDAEEESLARILLAEELVTTLVQDLQVETEKRTELERQRVEWLAKEAVDGVEIRLNEEDQDGEGHIFFDLDEHDHDQGQETPQQTTKDSLDHPKQINGDSDDALGLPEPTSGNFTIGDEDDSEQPSFAQTIEPKSVPEVEAESSRPPTPSPLAKELAALFEPLTTRYSPLQKSLHDLSLSLSTLRTSLPTLESSPISPTSASSRTKRHTFLPLRQTQSVPPSSDPTLLALLDGIHEVIEDARVDVEIALADHERVYRGFEALLNVGGGKKDGVMRDVREYSDEKSQEKDEGWKKLDGRVNDVENDLASMKKVIYELEGIGPESEEGEDGDYTAESRLKVWEGLDLKTLSISQALNVTNGNGNGRSSPLSLSLSSPLLDHMSGFNFTSSGNGNGSNSPSTPNPNTPRRATNMLSSVGNVGRSFSASVIGAPRRVGGLAMGVYRPNGKKMIEHDHNREREGEEEIERFLQPREDEVE